MGNDLFTAVTCLSSPVELHGFQLPAVVIEEPYNSSVLYECDHGYWYKYGIYNVIQTCNSEGDWFPTYFPCTGY